MDDDDDVDNILCCNDDVGGMISLLLLLMMLQLLCCFGRVKASTDIIGIPKANRRDDRGNRSLIIVSSTVAMCTIGSIEEDVANNDVDGSGRRGGGAGRRGKTQAPRVGK